MKPGRCNMQLELLPGSFFEVGKRGKPGQGSSRGENRRRNHSSFSKFTIRCSWEWATHFSCEPQQV